MGRQKIHVSLRKDFTDAYDVALPDVSLHCLLYDSQDNILFNGTKTTKYYYWENDVYATFNIPTKDLPLGKYKLKYVFDGTRNKNPCEHTTYMYIIP